MSNDQDLPPEEGSEGVAGTDNTPPPSEMAGAETMDDGAEAANVDLEDLGDTKTGNAMDDGEDRTASDLEAVFDVPVNVAAVLGKSYLQVSQLLKLAPGAVLELDRKVGEAIDIYVNDRLVARGEVVMVEERLGVTMTEIIKGEGQ